MRGVRTDPRRGELSVWSVEQIFENNIDGLLLAANRSVQAFNASLSISTAAVPASLNFKSFVTWSLRRKQQTIDLCALQSLRCRGRLASDGLEPHVDRYACSALLPRKKDGMFWLDSSLLFHQARDKTLTVE